MGNSTRHFAAIKKTCLLVGGGRNVAGNHCELICADNFVVDRRQRESAPLLLRLHRTEPDDDAGADKGDKFGKCI